MARRPVFLLLVFAIAVGGLFPVAAQDATPDSGDGKAPLDLAAMLLVPADLDALGLTDYGVGYPGLVSRIPLEGVAIDLADRHGEHVANARAALEDAGWQRAHANLLGTPVEPGSSQYGATITIVVHEFATAEGATVGFALFGRDRLDPARYPSRSEPNARPFGDQSETTLLRFQSPQGRPGQRLYTVVRLDNLVAEVTGNEFRGSEPDLATAEALVERFLAKIERVRAEGGPGLSTRVVRLTGDWVTPEIDRYLRLAGEAVRTYPDVMAAAEVSATPAAPAPGTPVAELPEPVDSYQVYATYDRDAESGSPAYQVELLRFGSVADATARFTGRRELNRQPPNPETDGLVERAIVVESGPFGDASYALTFARLAAEGVTNRGYAVLARSGRTMVVIAVEAPDRAPSPAIAEGLMAEQLACLEAAALCLPQPMPGSLTALASDAAAPIAAAPPDLAAMTLSPADLTAADLGGYGPGFSVQLDAPALAAATADYYGRDAAAFADELQAAGFRRGYLHQIYRPLLPIVETAPGLFPAERSVGSSVVEYATAEGAAAGFALLEDERNDPTARDVPGSRTFGDQSEITLSSRTDPATNEPYAVLSLTFRLGNLVADASVEDYTGAEPAVATVEALAAALQAKVERVLIEGGPGLSTRVLRFEPSQVAWQVGQDLYTRIDGQDVPLYADLANEIRAAEVRPEATPSAAAPMPATPATVTPAAAEPAATPAGELQPVLHAYSFITVLGEGETWQPSYRVWLWRYPTAEDAAARVASGRAGADPDELVADAAPFGDESITIFSDDSVIDGVTKHGYRISARVGAEIVELFLEAKPESLPPLTVLEELMAAQIACLHVSGYCHPVPVPAALAAIVRVPATPLATADSVPGGAPAAGTPPS